MCSSEPRSVQNNVARCCYTEWYATQHTALYETNTHMYEHVPKQDYRHVYTQATRHACEWVRMDICEQINIWEYMDSNVSDQTGRKEHEKIQLCVLHEESMCVCVCIKINSKIYVTNMG